MIYIRKIYLDGTPLDEALTVAEFSPLHPHPALSWSIGSDTPGGEQAWYTLTLTDPERGARLYDSGRVESRVQSASFDAAAIPAGSLLRATLVVGSADGQVTEEAEEFFFNGALDDFPGDWITSREDQGVRVLRFCRDFTPARPVADAVLYTCGLGYHRATINGEPVTDAVLDPAHSNYSKVCYYRVTPDAAEYLQPGQNRLEIQVAPGWRNNRTPFMTEVMGNRAIEFYGESVLWALLRITYEDGTREDIATGADWLCAPDPRTSEIFNGETFDARCNRPMEDCDPAPARVTKAPGGVLRPMTLQPIREQEVYSPVEITQPKPGMFVVDFGQNIAGVVNLWLYDQLSEGQTVTLRHAEELNEDGTLFTDILRGAKQTDTYIAAGDDRDLSMWQPLFTYHGFRYCEVTGLSSLEPEDIHAVALHTDIQKRSSFTCGSALLNAIQKNLVMTEKDNMHSILTDCPQRDERMGWMNDATVRFEETPYNFDVSRIFPKIMLDIHNEQRAEGQFTCCAPFIYGGLPADPVCSSYLMAGKQVLMHCGELNAVDELFDGMAAWEDFLLSRSPDGTVDYSYYGDWAAPAYACIGGENGHAGNLETDGRIMSTGYSYFNCVTLADFARRTGRRDAERKYTEKAAYVRRAFLDTWFDPATAKVGKGSMGSQAFALWLDILPEESREAAARLMREDLVAHDYRITTGNLCTRYLMDMLAKYGYVDDAYRVLTREAYPSFGYMIQNEATTIWERFELKKDPSMNSHNHPMYGAVGSWFYQYLGGITPTEPGFARVTVNPCYPEGLLSAHAVVDTVMGELSVRWSKRYGKLYLFVQTPFGMTADIHFDGKVSTVGAGYHVFEKTL